jgi:hypothetical protein
VAGTDVIREFLVSLGFKVDEKGFRDFTGGIGEATKGVVKLATAVEATAGAVVFGVAKFASNLEQLYFSSKRVGSSATNLKAFDLAAQNFGASAEEARSSVEGLAAALRDNPGNVGLLQGLGVHLHRAKDGTVDAVDAMMQLSKKFSSGQFAGNQGYFAAKQFADQLGISELTLLAMRQPGFGQAYSKAQRDAGDFAKATADAHKFMTELRGLELTLEGFGARAVDALQNKLGYSLKGIEKWVESNGPRIAKELVGDLSKIVDAGEWLAGVLADLDKDTDGWSTKLLALGLVLKATGATSIIGGVLALGGAFGKLALKIAGADAAAGAATGGSLFVLLRRLGWVGAAAGAAVGGYELYKDSAGMRKEMGGQRGYLQEMSRALEVVIDKIYPRERQAQDLMASMGWTPAQIAGILANLETESPGLDPTKVGDHGKAYGIAQMHKPFWDLFKKYSGGMDIHDADFLQQLNFLLWDLSKGPDRAVGAAMRKQTRAGNVAKVMSLGLERPAGGAAEADRRAARAVKIEQKTDIHVHGVSGPLAAGKEAARQQRHVNADIARNLAGAPQ